jgi:hypothetical protein
VHRRRTAHRRPSRHRARIARSGTRFGGSGRWPLAGHVEGVGEPALGSWGDRDSAGLCALKLRPGDDSAHRVLEIYWQQVRPFDGHDLRQSTQPRARIPIATNALRQAVGVERTSESVDFARLRAPAAHQSAVDEITLCLAQQPLHRLQKLPGSSASDPFLYADSFLHDRVSRNDPYICCAGFSTLNTAPCGSVKTAVRPTDGMSNGWTMTCPPPSAALAAVASASSTAK